MGRYEAKSSFITVHADAMSRFWRTLWVAVGIDACTMIGGGMMILLKDYEVSTGEFWIALGVLVGKSVLASVAAYFLRLKSAPQAEKEREELLPVENIPVK